MNKPSRDLSERYSDVLAGSYDKEMPSFVRNWKLTTYTKSGLGLGDRVAVFCCGTGQDFPMIQERIGEGGSIHGFDFSAGMLEVASRQIETSGWNNVTLEECDVTSKIESLEGTAHKFDAAVCTLGMSVIPRAELAYENMKSVVKPGGTIIIGDYQIVKGWRRVFNPVCVAFVSRYGGSYLTHEQSLRVFERMERELDDIQQENFLFGLYRYCIGTTTSR